jgi:hypothetical protein
VGEPLVLKPRLLLGVKDVQEQTGLGRDAVLVLMRRAGPIRAAGRRLLVRPADLERVFEELKEDGPPT